MSIFNMSFNAVLTTYLDDIRHGDDEMNQVCNWNNTNDGFESETK